MSHTSPVRLGVAIATLASRVDELLALLNKLAQQDRPPDIVAVVLSGPDAVPPATWASALEAREVPFQLLVDADQTPGICGPRNKSLRLLIAAGADVIAIIDDDGIPSQDWCEKLCMATDHESIAAATGPVVADFARPPEPWMTEQFIYNRDRQPIGTSDGLPLVAGFATGNVALKREWLLELGQNEWFDPRYALTGGEDSDLAERLLRLGGQIAWVDSAIVYDSVPVERMTVGWAARRRYRIGNNQVSRLRNSHRLLSLDGLRLLLAIAARTARGVARLTSAIFRTSRDAGVSGLLDIAAAAGSVAGLFGRQYQEYGRAK